MVREYALQNRRTVLKTLGAVSISGALAGCSGGGNGGGGSDGGDGGDSGSGSGGSGSSGDGDSGSGGSTETEAQSSFPEQPIRMIIPYGPGGGFDYYTRLVSKYMEEELPVAVQPQNVTPDIAGHNQMYRAEPNGYTNGVTSVSSMSKAQVLREEANFDLTEMTIYPRIAGTTEVIAVGTHTDIESVDQLVTALQNEELNIYGESLTGGSILDLVAFGAVGGLLEANQITENFVQFGGLANGIAAMRRGDVDVLGSPLSSMLQYVESGDVRIIVSLTTGDPPERAPDGVVTLDDTPVEDPSAVTGFLGVEYDRVFAGPPDIPEDRAEVIRSTLDSVIQNPDLIAEAEESDRVINYASSEEAQAAVEDAVRSAEDNRELLEELFSS